MTRWIGVMGLVAVGCGGDVEVGFTGVAVTQGTDGDDTTTIAAGETSSSASTLGDPSTETSDGTTSSGFPDVGSVPPPPPVDVGVPETCADADEVEATVGCLFYGADLDGHPINQAEPWGVSVANIQELDSGLSAHVWAEVRVGGNWLTFEEVDLLPGELHLFLPGQFPHEPSARIAGATVRLRSDVPIVAHQFNPIAKAKSTSDASMLIPVNGWDNDYVMIGRPHIGEDASGELYPYVTIVAAHDDTVVEIVPNIATRQGVGVPAGSAGDPLQVTLDEGEMLQLAPQSTFAGVDLTGLRVTTDPSTPVAVFAGHRCAYVPFDTDACDHLEEQLSGRHQWGRSYAAVRAMPRLGGTPEPVLWQLVAAADTTIEVFGHEDVTGLPTTAFELAAGASRELIVSGSAEHPGDFRIESTEPVAVMQYLVGGGMAGSGDPSAIQLAPVDQFIERLVILVPDKWAADHLAITREAGATVWLDGEALDDDEFTEVDDSGTHEAARVVVEDGVHTLLSSAPLSAIVVGYDAWDSYGYLGGSRTRSIYEPQG